jgi:hypothetical protein
VAGARAVGGDAQAIAGRGDARPHDERDDTPTAGGGAPEVDPAGLKVERHGVEPGLVAEEGQGVEQVDGKIAEGPPVALARRSADGRRGEGDLDGDLRRIAASLIA